ncbi:unnamed protein product [Protopolystoma xenopodis]|uniref:Uncharacterized protein n=1 Tax=Protopolystoma xenopodis TaxID=117903 RepID=A0A3S5B748_9PLAT|nr:unnamed protein product [Protopolystoma xenopodis]
MQTSLSADKLNPPLWPLARGRRSKLGFWTVEEIRSDGRTKWSRLVSSAQLSTPHRLQTSMLATRVPRPLGGRRD